MLQSTKPLEEGLALEILEDSVLEPVELQLPRRRDLLGQAVLRQVLRIVVIFSFDGQGCPLGVEY